MQDKAQEIIKFMNGKKTVIFALIGAVIKIADIYGMLDARAFEVLMTVDAFLLAYGVRDAMRKIEKK